MPRTTTSERGSYVNYYLVYILPTLCQVYIHCPKR